MSQIRAVGTIENPRKYDQESVEQLQQLLKTGRPAQRDPRRVNFYEIDGHEETFYIHVSPVSGNVVLLAKWNRQLEGCCLDSDRAVA